MPAKSAKPQPRADRAPLSRERIAAAGLEIADREGVDALSMRRLADELGAGTMTLYWHFSDKRELLDAVIDAAVAESELPALEGPWRDRIRTLVAYSRDLFARHPSVVEIWARQPVLGGVSLRWVEAVLQILHDEGFPDADAARAFRLLITYVHGFAMFSRPRSRGDARDGAQAALAALPPEEYPRLTELAPAFAAAMSAEEAFVYGLERILDGLAADLEA